MRPYSCPGFRVRDINEFSLLAVRLGPYRQVLGISVGNLWVTCWDWQRTLREIPFVDAARVLGFTWGGAGPQAQGGEG